MNRVAVRPKLLRWARERSGRSADRLSGKFPKLPAWESGEVRPTFKQLERFARATFVPVGYLFLGAPPREAIPIPDLRTPGSGRLGHPSPDLLDSIYLCQLSVPAAPGLVPGLGAVGRRGAGALR